MIRRERVRKPEFLDGTTCELTGLFSDFFTWFSANECGGCAAVTVYYVRSIPDAIGCAYPGANWVTVAAAGDGPTLVQEIGHLADLWSHSSDPNNVMTDRPGGTADQITRFQCCMLRTSRFSSAVPCPRFPRVDVPVEAGGPEPAPLTRERGEVSHAFQRLRGPRPTRARVPRSGAAQVALGLAATAWLLRRTVRAVRR
jgi:hypothetical protein